MPNEALIHKRLKRVEPCCGYVLRRLDRATAAEDRQPGEEALLLGCEEVVGTTRLSRAQRLVPGTASRPPLEEIEALREPLEDLAWEKNAGVRCGELQREREPVERAAKSLTASVGSVRARSQKRSYRLGICQRLHWVLDLAADAQELAARHQDPEIRAGLDERGQFGRSIDYLLEVVEDQQELALG